MSYSLALSLPRDLRRAAPRISQVASAPCAPTNDGGRASARLSTVPSECKRQESDSSSVGEPRVRRSTALSPQCLGRYLRQNPPKAPALIVVLKGTHPRMTELTASQSDVWVADPKLSVDSFRWRFVLPATFAAHPHPLTPEVCRFNNGCKTTRSRFEYTPASSAIAPTIEELPLLLARGAELGHG